MARRYPRGRKLGDPIPLRNRYSVRLLKGAVLDPTMKQVQRFIEIHKQGRMLNRSRISEKAHKNKGDTSRQAILRDLPVPVPFVVISKNGPKPFATRVTDVVSQPIVDPDAALKYFGAHAPAVIRGFTIKPTGGRSFRELLRLLDLLRKQFPRAYRRMVELDYDPDEWQKLIDRGKLAEPPENMLGDPEVTYRIDFPDPDKL